MERQKGSSLAELILTLVFVGVAIPALFAFFANTTGNAVDLDLQTRASVLAQEKLELISGDRYDPSRGLDWVLTSNRYPTEKFDEFSRIVNIQPAVVKNIDGFQVTIVVTHPALPPYNLSVFFTRY